MTTNDPKIIRPDAEEIFEFGGSSTERAGADDASVGSAETQPIESNDLVKQVEDWKDKTLRAKAELQNVQRRAAQERVELIRYAHADFARSLLAVLSDLERTINAGDGASQSPALLNGVKLVRDNLLKVLTQFGIVPIEALHQPFDPKLHEALMQQPSAEYAPGTVIQEYERGYTLHDRVLKPSRVVVAAPPA